MTPKDQAGLWWGDAYRGAIGSLIGLPNGHAYLGRPGSLCIMCFADESDGRHDLRQYGVTITKLKAGM